jgi:hypothetical protein
MKPTHEPHQRLRLGDTSLLVALDSSNQRLLKYQELDSPAAAAAPGGQRDSSSGHHGGHHHHHHHHHHGRRGRSSQVWKLDASFWSERDCVQVSAGRLMVPAVQADTGAMVVPRVQYGNQQGFTSSFESGLHLC